MVNTALESNPFEPIDDESTQNSGKDSKNEDKIQGLKKKLKTQGKNSINSDFFKTPCAITDSCLSV